MLFFLLLNMAWAQSQNYPGAASQVLDAATQPSRKGQVKADTIRGECKYLGGWCTGSVVNLKDASGQVVQTLIISSQDSLQFAGVRPGVYSVEITFDHGKRTQAIPGLNPGGPLFTIELQ